MIGELHEIPEGHPAETLIQKMREAVEDAEKQSRVELENARLWQAACAAMAISPKITATEMINCIIKRFIGKKRT